MPAHKPGESVEGLEIQGHSRDPVRSHGMKRINGIKCFLYKAEFNVSAEITAELASGTRLIYGKEEEVEKIEKEKKVLTTKGESIGCDTALITTIAVARTPHLFRQKTVSHISHRHGAHEWEFNQQTNVKVVTPRQEIINALQKREDSISRCFTPLSLS